MGNVKGLDISHWQGDINFANVPEEYRFIYMKSSEGTWYQDDKFIRNYNGFGDRQRAPYHFWRHNADPGEQARYWRDTVDGRLGEWGPVVDLEDTSAPKGGSTPDLVAEFLLHVEVEFGTLPLIYSAAWWWDAWIREDFASNYGLLVANYKTVYPWSEPYMPRTGGWLDWLIWQHSSSGRVPGFSGAVDLNVFNGDDAEYDRYMGIVPGNKVKLTVPIGMDVEVTYE